MERISQNMKAHKYGAPEISHLVLKFMHLVTDNIPVISLFDQDSPGEYQLRVLTHGYLSPPPPEFPVRVSPALELVTLWPIPADL